MGEISKGGANLQEAHGLCLQLQFLYRLREEAESREEALL